MLKALGYCNFLKKINYFICLIDVLAFQKYDRNRFILKTDFKKYVLTLQVKKVARAPNP